MVGSGSGVPLYVYGLSGVGVDVGGVAWGDVGEWQVWGVLACGETGLGSWVTW